MTLRMLLILSCAAALGCSGDRSDDLNKNLGTAGRDGEVGGDGAVVDAGGDDVPLDAGEPDAELDASEPDAGDASEPDASEPDATVPTTGFQLSLRNLGQPLAGRTVLLHTADGAVLEQAQTDATGSVFREQAPAMATVLITQRLGDQAHQVQLLTFFGTKDGDRLVVTVEEDPQGSTRPLYMAQLQTPLPTGTNSVEVHATRSCVSGYSNTQMLPALNISSFSGCQLPAQGNTLLATANNSSFQNAQAFAVARNVALPSAGAVPLVFGPWLTPSPLSLRMTGTRPRNVPYVNPSLTMVIDGQRFGTDPQIEDFPATPATFSVLPSGVSQVEASADFSSGTGTHSLLRSSAVQSELTLDFGDRLPTVEAVDVDDSDNTLRPVLTFSGTSGLDKLDAVYLVAQWSYEGSMRWGFVGPATETSFTVPELPSELASTLSDFQPGVPSLYSITFLASDLAAGYDGFRRRPFAMVQDYEPTHLLQWPLLPNESAQLVTWLPIGI